MSPFRLFVILVMLTATALAVVYLRTANVRTAHRVQKLHKRQVELRYQVWDRQADIARLSEPNVIEKRPDAEPGSPIAGDRDWGPPSSPSPTPGADPDRPQPSQEWETD